MNKNIMIAGGVITVLIVLVVGKSLSSKDAQPQQETTEQSEQSGETAMAEDESVMMGTGYLMEQGKMIVEEGEHKSPMTSDVTFDDGTVVKTNGEVVKKNGETRTLTEGQSMWSDGTFMEAGEMMEEMEGSDHQVSALSRYQDYSEKTLAQAVAKDNRVVLFFAALGWCPSCQAADKDFQAHFDQLPEDVTILKVDYDNDKEMKKKYSIVSQDTFVQIDGQGQTITKWNSGGQGVKSLLSNIQ